MFEQLNVTHKFIDSLNNSQEIIMPEKFKRKIFTIKNDAIELKNNSIVSQQYNNLIDTESIIQECTNNPIFHSDNNIDILNDFIEYVKTTTEQYKTIHMIIDKTCFITLTNQDFKHINSLYISYENIITHIVKVNITTHNNITNCLLAVCAVGFIACLFTKK